MIIKLGESVNITPADIQPVEKVLADPEIEERFRKYAEGLKEIAPKAKDFLYFTAVMMHAAEASLIDENGEIKKDANGNPLEAKWEKSGNGIKWVCSDSNTLPYRNSNRDIFPESELIQAHKKWIGRPLCVDHKSSEAEAVRGCIVDTYYDRRRKCVVALCALDKVSYPKLAKAVSSGYSTNVSMGTAVGKAVCSDCYNAATTEAEFCQHMRAKSCYGEINLELSPIELSIVVNGADPGAKIKQVIAKDLSRSADAIADYLDKKQGDVSGKELTSIKADLKSLNERVDKLIEAEKEDSNDTSYGTTGSSKTMTESEFGQVTPPPNYPDPIPTVTAGVINELKNKIHKIEEEISNITNKNSEEKMPNEKQAWYQGTEEPTPGKPQYKNETDYAKIRDTQDKQMVGQKPFPGVGPVDGMHPGHESFGETEEARKRRLQRLASVKERSMRRQAALEKAKQNIDQQKQGYYQGTEEPKPGQVQYPNETDYRQIRDNEDKQMVGQKPFPDVGPVDGLHPSPESADEKDELKRKQMLSRAKLRAQFAKVAGDDGKTDLSKSHWKVFAGDNLILTASVADITGGNVTEPLYNAIATKQFGLDIISKIKTVGFENTLNQLKKTAQTPAQAQGAPGVAADAMPAPAEAPMGDLEAPEGGGAPEEQEGNLIEKIQAALDEAQDYISELKETSGALEGEMSELGDIEPAPEAAFNEMKSASVKDLQAMRKTLNRELTDTVNECIAALNAHRDELRITANVFKNASNLNKLSADQRKYLQSLVATSLKEAKSTFGDVGRIKAAFVRYAHGTEGLMKRAAEEAKLSKKSEDYEGKDKPVDESKADDSNDQQFMPEETITPKSDAEKEYEEMKERAKEDPGEGLMPDIIDETGGGALKPMPVPHGGEEADPLATQSANDGADKGDAQMQVTYDTDKGTIEMPVSKASASDALSTKEARAQYRVKLAQKAIEGITYSDMTGRAHPKGGHDVGGIDAPQDQLHRVETTEEEKQKHMDVVNATPEVKKQAAKIQKLVSEGQLEASEVDSLVAHGVDSETVKYWKQYYGEAKDKDASQWASELVKEHDKTKKAEELEKEKVRIKRAYELAYEMRDKGMIESNQINDQVAEISKWNDEAFESTKRMVAKQAMRKQAMPQVGFLNSGDVMLPSAEASSDHGVDDLKGVFDIYFAGKKL